PSFGPSGSAAPPPFENPEPAGEGLPKQSSPEKVFDVKAAVGFLQSLQGEDGSISSAPFLNDWLALAIPGNEQLKAYLLSDPNPGDLLTDYERRAMALHALGINPYSGTSTNYIAKILEGFDGTQFGNQDLANDDIFALIPLSKAGYTLADPEVEKTVSFILSWQQSNGSWSDVDSTAAAVQALLFAKDKLEVQVALDRAKLYLISQKQEDNSFGNAYSTSWALQALQALGENVSSSGLADLQAEDGGLLKDDSLNNRIWATAYAIPAAEGKSWSSILQSFEKPQVVAEPEVTTAETPEAVLLSIQVEVEKIGLAVAALEPQVALLYNQHLAKIQQEQRVASISQEIARVQNEIEKSDQASFETASQAKLEQKPATSVQVASVENAFPVSGGLGAKQFILLIVAASAIFLLAGGTNLVSPLLRKLAMRV
ncbi:MAG: prenyltransferase/squalene oxidase repeat-containing protein, partial [Candidatus Wildermuthbacteria bacterium]|nr:prenyltransferase/squalene oxidase repeat-containing protein [Candidatus Wildermuthbacteria bacterium]